MIGIFFILKNDDVQIPQGFTHEKTTVITDEDTAIAFGTGLLTLFATPAMIALLEATAHEGVQLFFPCGHTSAGSEIHISHLKASTIGQTIKAEIYLNKTKGAKLFSSSLPGTKKA